MKLKVLATTSGGGCASANCPTIYATDRDTFVVQGRRIAETLDISVPANEEIVEVPVDLIRDLLKSDKV